MIERIDGIASGFGRAAKSEPRPLQDRHRGEKVVPGVEFDQNASSHGRESRIAEVIRPTML